MAIYSVLMGGVVLFMLRRPAVAIAAVLCMFGLEQWAQSQGGFLATHTAFANLVVGLLVVFGCSLLLVRGQLDLHRYPAAGWVVLTLLGFALASYFWTLDREAFIRQWTLTTPYLVTVVLLMPLLVRDWLSVRSGLLATIALGAVVLALLAFRTDWTYRGVALSSGEMGNPLAVASLAGYVMLIATLMNFQGAARIWQLLRWPVVVLGLYIAVLSGSRGQAIAALVAAICFLPMSRRFVNFKGFVITILGLAIIAGIAIWAQQQIATDGRWRMEAMTSNYAETRIEMTTTVLNHWIHGGPVRWFIGLGNSASFNPNILGSYPHIIMAEVLAEEGLIGFVLLWMVLILALRSVLRCYRWVADDPSSRGLLAVVAGLFVFEVLLTFKQGSLIGRPYSLAFAIILGRMELSLQPSSSIPIASPDQDRHL